MSVPTGENPSFILNGIRDVTFEDRPIPEIKTPNDVKIRIEVTGICGSDVHYWQHGSIGPFVLESPMVLGHESSGVIVEVGSAVTSLVPGDRVALEPGIPCRFCPFCKAGTYNLCVDMKFAATPPYDGSLAKYYILPADFCVKLPENVSFEEGALVEPLSVGIHVAKLAAIGPGESVVIFGAGPIGLLCAAVARAFGATTVIVVDIVEDRLTFAKQYAATGTFNGLYSRDPKANAAKIKEEFSLGFGADKVIEASGAPPCIQAGIYVIRHGGTFIQVGQGPADVNFPIVEMSAKELTVRGSFRYGPGDYKLAVEMIASGRLEVASLVTGRWSFADAEKAFEETLAGKGIKVLIKGPE